MRIFALPEPLRNNVFQYLAQRPYAEVVALINTLAKLQEVPTAPLALVPKEGEGE